MSFNAMEEARGDLGRLPASWGNIQLTMYVKLGDVVRSEGAAKFALEGECVAAHTCFIVVTFSSDPSS